MGSGSRCFGTWDPRVPLWAPDSVRHLNVGIVYSHTARCIAASSGVEMDKENDECIQEECDAGTSYSLDRSVNSWR